MRWTAEYLLTLAVLAAACLPALLFVVRRRSVVMGLLVFAVSSFVPILHFAWLMVLLLLSALVGDLLFLPAILAGPLGRCFATSKSVQAVPQAKAANLIEE